MVIIVVIECKITLLLTRDTQMVIFWWKRNQGKKINYYISIPSLEQWLVKLQGSLINAPAFPELPSDMMKGGFLASQGVKREPFRTEGAEWRGHHWITARECQITFCKHVCLIFWFLEFLDRVLDAVRWLESPSQEQCWWASRHPDALSPPASVSLGPPASSSRCQRHSEALSYGRSYGSPSVFTQTPSALRNGR